MFCFSYYDDDEEDYNNFVKSIIRRREKTLYDKFDKKELKDHFYIHFIDVCTFALECDSLFVIDDLRNYLTEFKELDSHFHLSFLTVKAFVFNDELALNELKIKINEIDDNYTSNLTFFLGFIFSSVKTFGEKLLKLLIVEYKDKEDLKFGYKYYFSSLIQPKEINNKIIDFLYLSMKHFISVDFFLSIGKNYLGQLIRLPMKTNDVEFLIWQGVKDFSLLKEKIKKNYEIDKIDFFDFENSFILYVRLLSDSHRLKKLLESHPGVVKENFLFVINYLTQTELDKLVNGYKLIEEILSCNIYPLSHVVYSFI